jgi:thiosulfate/3-mercaptopyruvate sulfurtransferase
MNSISPLVDSFWLTRNLDDPNVRLVECDADPTLYHRGHISGATRLACQLELVDHNTRDIVGLHELERVAARLGIASDTDVVLYGDQHNLWACFAYWIFRMYGHARLHLLDGGRDKWLADGGTLVQDLPAVQPTRFEAMDRIREQRALRDDVLAFISRPDPRSPSVRLYGRALIDDRTPGEFNGEYAPDRGYPSRTLRIGHIPGAVNVPWYDLLRPDGTFKELDELLRLLRLKGITPDQDIVVYTRIGERAALTWFVLREVLGFRRVRNYDGSWTEWGNAVGLPIESGGVVLVAARAQGRNIVPRSRAAVAH